MAREAEERKRREEEARFMAEQQRLRDEAQRTQEEKEAQERAKVEQEENERLQRQVSHPERLLEKDWRFILNHENKSVWTHVVAVLPCSNHGDLKSAGFHSLMCPI